MLASARWTAACLLLLATACANAPPAPPPPPEWTDARRAEARRLVDALRAEPTSASGLSVRLAFPAGVDLDLYVTDPRLETVYYANTPSVSGGRLLADRRCGDAPASDAADAARADVRIETVRFDAPPPGRYRIGVDFPHRCDDGPDEVPYAIAIDDRGGRVALDGLARWLEFTAIVREFDVR